VVNWLINVNYQNIIYNFFINYNHDPCSYTKDTAVQRREMGYTPNPAASHQVEPCRAPKSVGFGRDEEVRFWGFNQEIVGHVIDI
jgi:hypothetical protein